MVVFVDPPLVQSFVVDLATDGDVTSEEIRDSLDALGYHVRSVRVGFDHEHPCPTVTGCLEVLRRDGHSVPDGVDCCVCWQREHAVRVRP